MNSPVTPAVIPELAGATIEELGALAQSLGQPSFRGRQIFRWIHRHLAESVDQMTDLPAAFRSKLVRAGTLSAPRVDLHQSSRDGSTQKFLFAFPDGARVESVAMLKGTRLTVCLSSQVGCALDCTFCATGKMGWIRNLTAGEILSQLLAVRRAVGTRISNVVFMGMGEPMLNYDAVVKAATLMHDPEGLDIGAGHITISTAGIVPGIRRLADERERFKLAFSLNASSDASRTAIMPITRKYSLRECVGALKHYCGVTGRRVTIEYVLMAGVNDRDEDAERIAALVRGVDCKLNVIPYNPIEGESYRRPSAEEVNRFVRKLLPAEKIVTVRWSHGTDVAAGCGQLWIKQEGRRRKSPRTPEAAK